MYSADTRDVKYVMENISISIFRYSNDDISKIKLISHIVCEKIKYNLMDKI